MLASLRCCGLCGRRGTTESSTASPAHGTPSSTVPVLTSPSGGGIFVSTIAPSSTPCAPFSLPQMCNCAL
jgi:hypothetical protein